MALTKMYNLSEVQEILSISRRTMMDYVHSGRVKAVKVGGKWKVSEAEVKRIADGGLDAPAKPRGRSKKSETENTCL